GVEGCAGLTALAIARGRMTLVERGRTLVSGRSCAAGEHPDVGRGLVTGHAGRARHRRVARDAERGTGDVRRAELEAAGIHIRRAVAARAVAIRAADRNVIAGRGDYGDVDEGPDRGTVTGETPAHTLVRAGDGVEREVARGGVALRAHGGRWDVIGRLRGCGEQIRCESGCGHVAVAAVATGRVLRIECGRT